MLHQVGPRRGPQISDDGLMGGPLQGQPPPSIGIDRPCVDPTAFVSPFLGTALFEGPPIYPMRPHPIFARYVNPKP